MRTRTVILLALLINIAVAVVSSVLTANYYKRLAESQPRLAPPEDGEQLRNLIARVADLEQQRARESPRPIAAVKIPAIQRVGNQNILPVRTPVAASTFPVTVAAVNLLDRTVIQSVHIKEIYVTAAEFDQYVNALGPDGKPRIYLHGKQPVGRIVKEHKAIKAEEPIYEDCLEPLAYPEPVSKRLRAGMRAVIVEVPSKMAMVQVGDHVDVLCTLKGGALGPGRVATAVLAKNLRVIARFGSTSPGAKPAPGDQTRTYTLEATPYEHELIELARAEHGSFTLSVSKWIPPEETPVSPGMPESSPR